MEIKTGDKVIVLEHPCYTTEEFEVASYGKEYHYVLVRNNRLCHTFRWPVDKLKKVGE